MSRPPREFGRYVLRQRLAPNPLTEDWAASPSSAGAQRAEVVVRRLLPDLCRRPQVAAAFGLGARATQGLEHPNLVKVVDGGEVDAVPFLAQEAHPGRLLSDLLSAMGPARPMRDALAVWVCREVLRGLSHANPVGAGQQGQARRPNLPTSHRDLAPDQVWVGFDGSVRLAGLGRSLAGDLAPSGGAFFKRGWLYQPPERVWGHGVDAATDVFGAGVLLVELLSGHAPITRDQTLEALSGVIEQHARARVVDFSHLACPTFGCGWKPEPGMTFSCRPPCLARWAAFELGSACPRCDQTWDATQCPKCLQGHPLAAWCLEGWDEGLPPAIPEKLRLRLFDLLAWPVGIDADRWNTLPGHHTLALDLQHHAARATASNLRERFQGPQDFGQALDDLLRQVSGGHPEALAELMRATFPEVGPEPVTAPARPAVAPGPPTLENLEQVHLRPISDERPGLPLGHTGTHDEPEPAGYVTVSRQMQEKFRAPTPASPKAELPPAPPTLPQLAAVDARTDPVLEAPKSLTDFGRYRLLARLGQGGMAQTWKAQMVGAAGVSKQVVIKRILPELAEDPQFVEDFIGEARLTATLSHGNLAQVFDFGQLNGEHFLVMEFVDGRTLESLIERTTQRGFLAMPPEVAVFITTEVLKGLQYVHTRTTDDGRPLGIVHRDISPDNVLIGFDGQTKIVDFGVAKSRIPGRSDTAPGVVKGKWHYLSPEQARGDALDGRSDLFATGIVLYRMLCNRLPFSGSSGAAIHAIALGEYPPPAAINPTLAPALTQLVTRSLEASRVRRYQDAQSMEAALREHLAKTAPSFSPTTLGSFVRWVFEDELRSEGRDLKVPADARQLFEQWKDRSRLAVGDAVANATTRPARPEVHRTLGTRLRLAAPWLGLLALCGAVAGLVAWLVR